MKNKRIYKNIKTSVKKVVYYNQKNNWGVLSVRNTLVDDPFFQEDTVMLSGTFYDVYEGSEIVYTGEFYVHSRYGNQIVVSSLQVCKDLKKKEAIINFLVKSGIKGISYQLATKIYQKFEKDSIRIVLNETEKIKEVLGIGEGTYKLVLSSIDEYKRMESLLNYCTNVGIPYAVMHRLHKDLGDDALEIIKDNIYSALEISENLTFNQLDEVALKSGIRPDDPNRLRACLLFCLRNRIIMTSSTGCNTNDLRNDFVKKIGLTDINLYTSTINKLREDEVICTEGTHVFYKLYYDKEEFIAKTMANLAMTPTSFEPSEDIIQDAINSFPFELNDQQKNAVYGILGNRVSILTGGPGSGKSTITRALVDILSNSDVPYRLLSPTGKATRRIEECTGRSAQTIHKFLKVKTNLNDTEPPIIPANTYLIIDECSMVDILMLAKLAEIALTNPINFVFVGDKDQLPSVQAGNILADLLASGRIPAYILTDIMRQAKDSHIIQYCADINNGNSVEQCSFDDFIYKEYDETNELINDLQDIYVEEVRKQGLNNVQVISPYKKGSLGVNQLNIELSRYYNPNKENEAMGFKLGDKVMQIVNDYSKDIFNGEVGVVSSISDVAMEVTFNDNNITYYPEDLNSLTQAYACTCHKSQGAEYATVIVVLDDTSGSFLLTRKLLYTAVSRGKKKVYILSKPGCLASCIKNIYECPRITKLSSFVAKELPDTSEILELA